MRLGHHSNYNIQVDLIRLWYELQRSKFALALVTSGAGKHLVIDAKKMTSSSILHWFHWTLQSMTKAVSLTLGQSQNSHIKKLGLRTKSKAEGTKFCKFCLGNSLSSPNSKVECIKYNILDFCNYLLVTANFFFEN